MNTSRRNFLKMSALASGSALVPAFLKGLPGDIFNPYDGKVLVIVQLSGGNDGLNTIVPYRNDLYHKYRPSIGYKKEQILKLNDELGLNPAMAALKSIYDQGQLSILNGVGYPNPNRSHFRSMDIWQTGSSATENLSTGWIGRYLDNHCQGCVPHYALEVDDTVSLALKGREVSGFAMGNPKSLRKTTSGQFLKEVAQSKHHKDEHTSYLYKMLTNTQESAKYLYDKTKIYKSGIAYPNGRFGKDLKQVAELIIAQTNAKIYYVNLSGFDTHANQKGQQERLLKQYAEGMKAFMKDMKQNRRANDVLVMTFSEFGRRVKQNASRGTDHGTANSVFLMGGNLKQQGIYNDIPSLMDLDNGDLKYTLDFRNIYATILRKWMDTSPSSVLGQSFESLNII